MFKAPSFSRSALLKQRVPTIVQNSNGNGRCVCPSFDPNPTLTCIQQSWLLVVVIIRSETKPRRLDSPSHATREMSLSSLSLRRLTPLSLIPSPTHQRTVRTHQSQMTSHAGKPLQSSLKSSAKQGTHEFRNPTTFGSLLFLSLVSSSSITPTSH